MLQQFYPAPPKHPFRFELHKDMNFAAAHFVPHLDAGACANMHGHTYFVDIAIAGDELDHTGFLVNFGELKKLIHGKYDHSVMNNHEPYFTNRFDEPPTKFPTTEIVAQRIFRDIREYLVTKPNHPVCLQVVVRETPTSYVIYRNPDFL